MRLLAAGACAIALLAGGCASTGTSGTSAAEASRRALSQPDRLKPVGADGLAIEWIDPAVNFGKYERVLIERIRVNLDSDSAAVDPADLKALTDYFHQTLVKTLQPRFPVVETPGPNVLRVRVTLVDLVATKPEVSVIVLVTPYATVPDLALSAASGGPTGSAPYLGRTGVAVQFIDGESNAVVAEYAEEDFGRKFVLDEKGDVGATLSKTADGYTKAFSTWAYAKQAMDRWALMFRTRLEAAGKPRPA